MRRSIRFLAILAGLAAFACAPLAHGAGTVTKCNETSLRTALKGGGSVTFGCSGTITLASTLNITAKTTVDGGGQSVTLSGGNSVGVIAISAGIIVTLKNLTIQQGRTSSGVGGGISNLGTLTVTNCNFGGSSGTGNINAIWNGGSLTVNGSTFSQNVATNGGAIIHTGSAKMTVTGSTFTNNFAGSAGGAIVLQSSSAEIRRSFKLDTEQLQILQQHDQSGRERWRDRESRKHFDCNRHQLLQQPGTEYYQSNPGLGRRHL